MAHLCRVPKPAHDWTQQDLVAYNIHVHPQPQSIFFNGLSSSGGDLPVLPTTSPLHPFLTTPLTIPKGKTTNPTTSLLSLWNRAGPVDFQLDGMLENFLACLLRNMGPPYLHWPGENVGRGPELTLQICRKKYPAYSDLCVYSNYLITNMIDFLGTHERFVGLDTMPLEEDAEPTFNFDYWKMRPLDSWPRDDAEAKLVAMAIATYNFNNFEVPKLYDELDEGDKEDVDPYFTVHDPMFLPGMAWKGTHPSFYKISIRSDLVKAVRAGNYPPVPTKVYRYTPTLPEVPEEGMDKLWMNAMKPLANRRLVIGCLEAFKMFLRVKRLSVAPSYRANNVH